MHTDNRPLDSVAAASEQVATPLNSDKLIGVQLRNEANNLVVFNFASPTGVDTFPRRRSESRSAIGVSGSARGRVKGCDLFEEVRPRKCLVTHQTIPIESCYGPRSWHKSLASVLLTTDLGDEKLIERSNLAVRSSGRR